MADYILTKNKDGSITKTLNNGKSYVVPVNDSLNRYEVLAREMAGTASSASSVSQGNPNQLFAAGGSGKEYVYNPQSGNIGINNGGSTHYVSQDDPAYSHTLKAMADDGVSFNAPQNKANLTADFINEAYYSPREDETLKNYLRQLDSLNSQLLQAQSQGDTALTNAIKQALNQLEAQRPQIYADAKLANSNAYANYMQAFNPYGINAEANAALGLGRSGFQESSMIDLGNTYQNVLNLNEQNKLSLLQDLENAKIEAQLSGNIQRAEEAAKYARLIAENSRKNAQSVLDYQLGQEKNALERAQILNKIRLEELNRKQKLEEDLFAQSFIGG